MCKAKSPKASNIHNKDPTPQISPTKPQGVNYPQQNPNASTIPNKPPTQRFNYPQQNSPTKQSPESN
ncbi:hypothetical protein M8J75_007857 [Diaphorina citri]|nr:hypothetical protein M8J75_007857 [Diaphorina citri]